MPIKQLLASVIFWILIGVSDAGSEQIDKLIDLVWKARGLQELIKKDGNSKGKNLSKKESCEWIVESAYITADFCFRYRAICGGR